LGSDYFIDKIHSMILMHKLGKRDTTPCVETGNRVPLREVLGHGWTSRRERDTLIHRAYVDQGYTLHEIAGFLKIHPATVSRAVRRAEKRMTC